MATRTSGELDEIRLGEIVVKSPTEFYWTVPEFVSIPFQLYGLLKSPSFTFMDGEWCFKCWPKGSLADEYLWLGLTRVHFPPNRTIKYRLGIKAIDGSIESLIQEHEFEYDGHTSAVPLPVRIDYLRLQERFVIQQKVTFFCTFLSSCSESETHQDRPLKGADKLCQNFEDMFLSGDHHDIIIKLKDQEIRAHKFIIVARSPVFNSMFRHDMTEKNTSVITIEDCDSETFREFLFFLYSGRLKNVSAANVNGLYVIADKYQVDEVKSACAEFMKRNMSDETFCDFISLALRHNETDLLKFATNYFVRNVKTIIKTVKWRSFYKEYPDESNELYIKAITHIIPD